MQESRVDLPAFGKPTSPTSAIVLSSKITSLAFVISPVCE